MKKTEIDNASIMVIVRWYLIGDCEYLFLLYYASAVVGARIERHNFVLIDAWLAGFGAPISALLLW